MTLFIYPSAISKARYAMTWGQLKELQRTGLLDIQSHTFWHPNFRVEKRRLTPNDYRKFVNLQLVKAKMSISKSSANSSAGSRASASTSTASGTSSSRWA